MRQAVLTKNFDKALEDGKRLIGEYAGSAYASLAALELAKLAYQRGEKSVARNHLEWVTESAPDPALGEIARLRLGSLLLDMEDWSALEALLAQPADSAFVGEFAVLRGDMAAARGDDEAALAAYNEALVSGVENTELLRMKMVDVGGQPAAS
jgi:predicted negative regulator of RcsB-dependent stress response